VTGDDVTLLQPAVNPYDALTSIGKVARGRVLHDRGGYVEWRDGDQTQRWTLPDQPQQSQTPILTSVVEADTSFKTLRMNPPERYVLLADQDGRTLAVLALITTAAGPTYEQVDFDRIWPASHFDELSTRGVQRVQESYRDVRALNKAHAGAVTRWRVLLGSRASYWTQVVLLAAIILVVGVRVLRA
jgi:hypothetical protein